MTKQSRGASIGVQAGTEEGGIAMSNSGVSGTRVAGAIGVIKWVLIAVAVTAAVLGVLATVLANSEADTGADVLTVSLSIVAGTAVWVLFVWVLFGWFEHTLLALVAIARNTSPPVVASYEVPPAPYEQ